MNEQQAIEWIHKQLKFGIRPGLKRVERLLEQLQNPEKQLKIIHVAGTNGKGSTVSYLRNMLQAHGFNVGTFTSPYIETFNERMSINGLPISGQDLVKYVELIKPLCEQMGKTALGPPTEFEIITVIAFKYFLDKQVDYAIFEVGLGGRLDSTNVVEAPLLSIITSIGFDHTDILGDTIEEIAFEKSGIIKRNSQVITNVTNEQAYEVIQRQAENNNANIYQLNQNYRYERLETNQQGEKFTFRSDLINIDFIEINMSGQHQVENASLALYSFLSLCELENIPYDVNKIKESLKQTTWIGRFEIVHHQPMIILDGAHNVEAAQTLIQTLNERFSNKNVHIILSIIKGKPIDQIIQLFKKNFKKITLTTFDYFKSYRYDELKIISEKYQIPVETNWKKLLNDYINSMKSEDILVVTGSLYFISDVRRDFIPMSNVLEE